MDYDATANEYLKMVNPIGWRRDLDIRPLAIFASLHPRQETLTEVYHGEIAHHEISNDDQMSIHKTFEHPNPHPILRKYSAGSFAINSALWERHINETYPSEKILNDIKSLDATLPVHNLQKNLVVYSGVERSPAYLAGMEWNSTRSKKILTLPAFTSTSTSISKSIGFANRDEITAHHDSDHHGIILPNSKHILAMHLVAGRPYQLTSMRKISNAPYENEILLDRHMNFELHPRPEQIGHNPNNPVYLWHAHNGDSSPFKESFKSI